MLVSVCFIQFSLFNGAITPLTVFSGPIQIFCSAVRNYKHKRAAMVVICHVYYFNPSIKQNINKIQGGNVVSVCLADVCHASPESWFL